MKKFKIFLFALCGALTLGGCGSASADSGNAKTDVADSTEKATVDIAYQYGLAYAPLIIAQQQGLIEQKYKEATGKEVEVTWNQMSSGADINTAFISGSVNVGFMGIAPAITGISNNVGYKIFTGLSGQEHGLMTNDAGISDLGALVGSDKQIALVNIGSIQHIILGMALDNAGYDAHALDSNIVAMKHPDGMNALTSENVPLHLTTNPYLYMERNDTNLNEISAVSDIWSADRSFIVGIASEALYEENPKLYEAVCDAIEEAIKYVNENTEAAAEITYEYNGNTVEDELKYLKAGNYTSQTRGVFDLAKFMYDAEFIDKELSDYYEIVFSNVNGD